MMYDETFGIAKHFLFVVSILWGGLDMPTPEIQLFGDSLRSAVMGL